MKLNYSFISKVSISLSLLLAMVSCGKDSNKNSEEFSPSAMSSLQESSGLPNYRYVDYDSLISKYNLARDYQEEMMRMQQNLESEVKRHENAIQSLATKMQNNLQNNIYMTQASFDADQEKLNNMQANAQQSVAQLQANFQQAALISDKAVNDSIRSFIKDYNKAKGYDAIFIKDVTLYINPALDITAEVVEGLNARYNKKK